MFRPGDVVEFYSVHAGKRKYHLCLNVDGHYLYVNSDKRRTFAGDFVIACSEMPFLPPTSNGKSNISCTIIFRMSDADLRANQAKKKGSVSVELMRRLLAFAENSTVLSEEDKRIIVDGLGDWV